MNESDKKILIISKEFPPSPGGIGRHAADLAYSLNERGYSIDVIANMSYVEQSEIKRFLNNLPDGINIKLVPIGGIKSVLIRIIAIIRALLHSNYKKIIVTGLFSLWMGGLIKVLFSRNKVEAFVHGSELNSKVRIYQFLTSWALRKVDKIWAVSNFTAGLIPGSSKLSTDKIQVLPNGIRNSEWKEYKDVNNDLNWPGKPALLTIGNLSPRKGQHRVIKTLPYLIKKWPDIHYHIVGHPSNKQPLEDLINELDVQTNCTIHHRMPGRKDIAQAYLSVDIFIMLSENQPNGDVEGFGIAILEANSLGIPAIGAKGCGIEDAIQSGYNGEIVDGNSFSEIERAIIKILENYDRYSSNSEKWAKKFDWNKLTESFLHS